ncbi:hypothetical protein Ahy_A03g015321 [Arachis hypogaea]|uniref:Endonuclease/exonuclease/phosphatase domain-containing protein n=1 Tax=Arachis hypogaea TaxID=3818 RepID=A0A445E068_ARAHY|nr:hypothetical protein Ahy_A03g015321 [Arachis hypogaea]
MTKLDLIIPLLWKLMVIREEFSAYGTQHIVHLRPTSNNAATWLLSAIYGSPQRPNRRSLWISLHSLAANINLPWCILGDFNALLHDYERQGSTHSANSEACSDFQSCISDCGLVDLGYMDWPFIWKRGDLVERLDRGLCNLDWQLAFPEASFKHLPNFRSDHTTIFLQLSTEASYNRHRRPFCFVAAWISHPEFHRSVENSWKVQDSWSDVINFLRSSKLISGKNMKMCSIRRNFSGTKNPGVNGLNSEIATQNSFMGQL